MRKPKEQMQSARTHLVQIRNHWFSRTCWHVPKAHAALRVYLIWRDNTDMTGQWSTTAYIRTTPYLITSQCAEGQHVCNNTARSQDRYTVCNLKAAAGSLFKIGIRTGCLCMMCMIISDQYLIKALCEHPFKNSHLDNVFHSSHWWLSIAVLNYVSSIECEDNKSPLCQSGRFSLVNLINCRGIDIEHHVTCASTVEYSSD